MSIAKRKIKYFTFISILTFLSVFTHTISAKALNVELTVKEVSGVGSNGFPVHSVVPLPYGKYQSTDGFHVIDDLGNTVPAQFEVHNRWWARDNSLRHIVVHFQPQVSAFTTRGTGQKKYWLKDHGNNIAPQTAVTVNNSNSKIVVSTGKTAFTINKSPFSIQTAKGKLQPELQFWDRVKEATNLQKSFDRKDIKIEIEENGPMRAVIKISAPTLYKSVSNHLHGWAIRLYAYAGKSYIKVDYQLQNSAKNAVFSAPLYFKSMNLVLETGDMTEAKKVKSVVVTKKEHLNLRGAISTGSTQAIIRNFTHMYPNGLNTSTTGKLTIELWPEWGEKFYWIRDKKGQNPVRKMADKYWLDDMQHVYKEVLLNFGTIKSKELRQLAETFQYPPVVSIPVHWYAETAVTLAMGGAVPYRSKISTKDLRKPKYPGQWDRGFNINNDKYYLFGWNVFAGDVERKIRPNNAGDIPRERNAFIVTENPADYYRDLDYAIGELNMRPQWMAGYNYERDQARLKLSENPYGGPSWRRFDGFPYHYIDARYLPESKEHARPRDNSHGWFYHVENAYNQSGNLWIKDWYHFIGEFRKTSLYQTDPFPDKTSRGQGHALNNAIQAYRVTGDTSILYIARDSFVHTILQGQLNPVTKVKPSHKTGEACFQLGYLSQALIDLYIELGGDKITLDMLTNFMDWNLKTANFSYYIPIETSVLPDIPNRAINGVGISTDNSFQLVDPQLWVALKLGRTDLIAHLETYLKTGINGGKSAAGLDKFKHWDGGFYGRIYTNYLLQQNKKPATASPYTLK